MGAGGGGDGGGGPALIGSARRGDRVVQTGQDNRVAFEQGTNERTGIARQGSNPPAGGTRIARAMGTSAAERQSNQRMADAFFTGRPMPGETYSVTPGNPLANASTVSTSDPYNIYSDPPPQQKKEEPKKEEPKKEETVVKKTGGEKKSSSAAKSDKDYSTVQFKVQRNEEDYYKQQMAELQAQYDKDLADYKAEVQASEDALNEKRAELEAETDKRKKKVKKGRKFGRLSLLYDSELGVTETKLGA